MTFENAVVASWLAFLVSTVPALAQTIPFDLQDNLVRIPVTIDGRSAVGVIDSGTGSIGIDRSFADRIGIAEGKALGEASGGGPNASKIRAVHVEALSVGPVRLTNIKAFTIDTGSLSSSAGFPIEVLIGAQFFNNHVVSVDYRRREITLDDKSKGLQCSNPIDFDLFKGVPVITAYARTRTDSATRKLRLIVDLGTRHHAVMLGGNFLTTAEGQAITDLSKPVQIGQGTGGGMMGWVSTLLDLRIGIASYENVDLVVTRQLDAANSHMVDGSLGVPLWNYGTIKFDYNDGKLCLPNPSGKSLDH